MLRMLSEVLGFTSVATGLWSIAVKRTRAPFSAPKEWAHLSVPTFLLFAASPSILLPMLKDAGDTAPREDEMIQEIKI